MFIKYVTPEMLGTVVAGLVAKGLTFVATPDDEGNFTIELTGGY